jgi:hypothetical protein
LHSRSVLAVKSRSLFLYMELLISIWTQTLFLIARILKTGMMSV